MRRNVAGQPVGINLTDKATGEPVTTGTASVYVTLDGGTQLPGEGTVSHKGNGTWVYVATRDDSDADHSLFTFVHASAVNQSVNVYPIAYHEIGKGVGSGNRLCPIECLTPEGVPVPRATVYVTADSQQRVRLTGDLLTDADGFVFPRLNGGRKICIWRYTSDGSAIFNNPEVRTLP